MEPGLVALVSVIQQGGTTLAAVLFAYLWWDERAEKRKLHAELKLVNAERLTDSKADGVRMTTALINHTIGLERNAELLLSLTRRGTA